MNKQNERQEQHKEAHALDNPDVVVVKIASAPKLSPRGEGGITYQIGRVGKDVYMRIEKNDGGGSFSKEWVPFEKIRAALTPAMKKGEPFKSDSLATAYVGKSQCNSGFLVASLRAERIFSIDAEHKGMSVLTGDLDAWEQQMREAAPALGDDGQSITVKLRPEPKETRFRKTTESPSEESKAPEGENAGPDSPPEEEDGAAKRQVRTGKKPSKKRGMGDVTVPPDLEPAAVASAADHETLEE